MKFKFRKATKAHNKTQRKALRLKGANTFRLHRERLPCPIGTRELSVTKEKKRGRFSLFFERIANFFKRAKKKRSKRPSRVSIPALIGTLCGALVVSILSGSIVVFSLFFSRGTGYTEVTIPNLVSMNVEKATEISTDIFEYTLVYEKNPDKAAGSIISQSPLPSVVRRLYGAKEKINITLTVNQEPETMTLPQVVGSQLREVELKLKSFGVSVQVIEQYSDTLPYGTVFFSSLPEGTKLSAGDKVVLKVSLGSHVRYSSVPDLSGLNEYEATALLSSKGLEVGDIKYSSSRLPIGTVISQSVAEGTSLESGSKISFTLSGGPYY